MQGSPFFLYPVPFSLCAWHNGGLPPFQCMWKKKLREAKEKIQKFVVMINFSESWYAVNLCFLPQGFFFRGVGEVVWVAYYYSVYTVHRALYFAILCISTILSNQTFEKVWNRTLTYQTLYKIKQFQKQHLKDFHCTMNFLPEEMY